MARRIGKTKGCNALCPDNEILMLWIRQNMTPMHLINRHIPSCFDAFVWCYMIVKMETTEHMSDLQHGEARATTMKRVNCDSDEIGPSSTKGTFEGMSIQKSTLQNM